MGLLAATIVLVASFGLLVAQSGENLSSSSNASSVNPGAAQAPAITFSLSAPSHISGDHPAP
jgi:hypothetical protein